MKTTFVTFCYSAAIFGFALILYSGTQHGLV